VEVVAGGAKGTNYDDAMSTRGPYAKSAAKREEILRIALEHFTRDGYDRVSVREVAREAGMTQAGLLHHFATKRDLFLEVIKWRHTKDADRFEPGTRAVDAIIDAAGWNALEPGLVRLYVLLSAEGTIEPGAGHDFFTERYDRTLGALSDDIARRQAEGSVRSDYSASELASLLVATADGLQLQWLLQPETVDMRARLRRFWEGLAAPADRAG
jgi:AcrR family transcriptional regulator